MMDVKTRKEEKEKTDKGDAQDRQGPKGYAPSDLFLPTRLQLKFPSL